MRSRLIQIALSIAFFVLVIQVVLVAPSKIRDAEQRASLIPTPPMDPTSDVDQSMNNMHMIETREGGKEWELWSEKARSLKAKETLELDVVKAILFSDSGVTYTVTGKSGRVHTKSKNLRVEGDVVTRSSNGYVFRTRSLDYDSAARRMTAQEAIEVTGPREASGEPLQMAGIGMDAKLDNNTVEILREVRSAKGIDGGKKALIRSRRALLSSSDHSARFFGDVVLDMESMRITGPEATFEYDKTGDNLKSVIFTGGARVTDMDKWATAQNVKVDFEQNRFIFRGDPRVVQNNDELRGEEIVFLDNGKRVQVKGARARVDQKRLEKTN